MKYIVPIILVLLATAVSAYDIDGGRRVGVSRAVLLSEPSASDFVFCPTAYLSPGRITVESGFLRRYDLSDLDQYYVAAAAEYHRFVLGIGASQFGKSDYYAEKILRSTVSYKIDSLAIGVMVSGKMVEFGNVERSYSSVGLGLSAGFNWNKYHIAAVADNINKPRLTAESEPDYRNINLYAEIEGSRFYSIVGRLNWQDHANVQATLGQIFHLTGNNALMWGISSNPLTYSGGLELNLNRYYIGYAVANHPTLGLSHSIVIGIKNLK